MKKTNCILLLTLIFSFVGTSAQELYKMKADETRWASFENPKAESGKGGIENKGAKGHAYEIIESGASVTLLDVKGAGIVQRIWITVRDRSPEMLRSLRLEMFWDGETKPAVSVPLGDFFSISHGQMMPFENALFSNPEGRSFNCFIPMPFRSGARITVTNDGPKRLDMFFYDVNFQTVKKLPKDALYFHCHWRREVKTVLGEDFNLLPNVVGKGRFIGVNFGLITEPEYGKSWWGEGEVKIYKDGDTQYPTLVGTGAEDYLGTGWGLGKFIQRTQGCTVADTIKGYWSAYRFHMDDAIYFQKNLRATIQVLGGYKRDDVRKMENKGVKIIPVNIHKDEVGCTNLLDKTSPPTLQEDTFPDGWVCFWRSEDYCATSYFYLDKPSNNLPAIQPLSVRVFNLHGQEMVNK
jgi:hypothetical protein